MTNDTTQPGGKGGPATQVVLRVLAVASVLTLLGGLLLPGTARAERDYRGMIERIDVYLGNAADLYRAGEVEGAKTQVQRAYFEVFENLEGTIRVNISAKRNFALESEFAEIRKMIIRGEPVKAVEARIAAHMAELWKVLPELESRFQIKAEAAAGDEPPEAQDTSTAANRPKVVEPHWTKVVEEIGGTLERADLETTQAPCSRLRI